MNVFGLSSPNIQGESQGQSSITKDGSFFDSISRLITSMSPQFSSEHVAPEHVPSPLLAQPPPIQNSNLETIRINESRNINSDLLDVKAKLARGKSELAAIETEKKNLLEILEKVKNAVQLNENENQKARENADEHELTNTSSFPLSFESQEEVSLMHSIISLESQISSMRVTLSQSRLERDYIQDELTKLRNDLKEMRSVDFTYQDLNSPYNLRRINQKYFDRIEKQAVASWSDVFLKIGSTFQSGTLWILPKCDLIFQSDFMEDPYCFPLELGIDTMCVSLGYNAANPSHMTALVPMLAKFSYFPSATQPDTTSENLEIRNFYFSKSSVIEIRSTISQMQLQMSKSNAQVDVKENELMPGSSILETYLMSRLLAFVPERFREKIWTCSHSASTGNSGALRTLLEKIQGFNPTIIVIKSKYGNLFGGFATSPWRIDTSYYGSGESFVFKLKPDFEIFKWTRRCPFFQLCSGDFIAMGGGAGFSWWLDQDLCIGTSKFSKTYGNSESLAGPTTEFICEALEIWTVIE